MLRVSGHSERTDVGRQRQANEDSYLARSPLFVVADGMGGAQAGEVASLTAIQAFQAGLPDGSPEESIERTIAVANHNIYEQAHADASLAGMGTTITVAAVDADTEQVYIGHVGDSRAYRLRDGIIQRLTRDHSLVEEMRRRGQITEEQAEDHPQRSIITRALGPEPEVQADLTAVPSEPGDVFLLCSDGLTTMISDEKISEILAGATSLDAAARTLVDEANRAGGRDNITVVIFQVEDPARPLPRGEQPTMIRRGGARRPTRPRRGEAETPKPRRRGRIIAGVLAACAVLLLLVGGVFVATRQAWFLGTDPAGRVALYSGLPYELPFGIDLYNLKYSTAVQTDSLPSSRQRSVTDNEVRSKDDAVSLIEDIESSEGLTG
ncbi:MAG: Stp1/IreP family PP2C-type Ser/Thr phosphatase [Solirubrobacterales bacterium]|nr:Stp1/IreP family PP2C-type Ser/Thr phosphatase [Solirubrobacterales bacterium]MCB8914273.1 Stp1/IreP family PP2C-type Ser/Thr phosphatase [Thermoleophilales bacterium]